jgi:hypothetical protein
LVLDSNELISQVGLYFLKGDECLFKPSPTHRRLSLERACGDQSAAQRIGRQVACKGEM